MTTFPVNIRWSWKKRKTGDPPHQAWHLVLRMVLQHFGPGWQFWLGTALGAIGIDWNRPDLKRDVPELHRWSGVTLALLPKLRRKEGALLYVFNWTWRVWELRPKSGKMIRVKCRRCGAQIPGSTGREAGLNAVRHIREVHPEVLPA